MFWSDRLHVDYAIFSNCPHSAAAFQNIGSLYAMLCRNTIAAYFHFSIEFLHCNFAADNSEPPQDQELLTHFLRNLASLAKSFDPSNLSQLLRASQDPQKFVTAAGTSSEAVITSAPNDVPEQVSGSPLCLTDKINCNPGTCGRQTDHSTIDIPSNGMIVSAGEAVPEVHSSHSALLPIDANKI